MESQRVRHFHFQRVMRWCVCMCVHFTHFEDTLENLIHPIPSVDLPANLCSSRKEGFWRSDSLQLLVHHSIEWNPGGSEHHRMCVLEAETGLRELGKILFTVVLSLLFPLLRVEGIKVHRHYWPIQGPSCFIPFHHFPLHLGHHPFHSRHPLRCVSPKSLDTNVSLKEAV